ncbi:hypothetical protein SUGI_0794040 [Cryptomeria japonica]|nr:hypothetical protein SUGI_0794040 [Cryptomeria japonica]
MHKEKVMSCGFGVGDVGKMYASLDGVADKLVYFCISFLEKESIDLIDGDKILALFAIFIKQQLNTLQEKCHSFKLQVVQAAYANGASTNYLRHRSWKLCSLSLGVALYAGS